MPITEADDKPTVVQVDQDALVNAFVAGAQRLGVGSQQQQQTATSEFETLFNHIKNAEGSDQDSLTALKQMFEAHKKDLKAEMTVAQRQELSNALSAQRDQFTIATIRTALDPLIGKDEFLKENTDVLEHRVIQRLLNDKAYAEAKRRYDNGDIDTAALTKLATEEVNKFNRGRNLGDSKAKGASGMSASEKVDGSESEGIENTHSDILNEKDLTPKEWELYQASLGTAQRLKWKRDSKEALSFASRQVRNLRAGQAKAKALYG